MSENNLLDRLPPQDLEAEAAALGSMIIDPEAAAAVAEIVAAEAFYSRRHWCIFEAIEALRDRSMGGAIDLIMLRDELGRRGKLDDAGGVTYLLEIVDATPSAANARHYAGIVRDKAVMRRLLQSSIAIQRMVHDGESSAAQVLDAAEAEVFRVSDEVGRRGGSEAVPVRDLMEQVFARANAGGIRGIPSGFTDIDAMTGGLPAADFIIVAGRPSMGKTTLALNMGLHVAGEGVPVALFSMEMDQVAVASNLVSMDSRVDMRRLNAGFGAAEEWRKVNEAIVRFGTLPFYIDDTPAGMTIMQLRAKARRIAARQGVKLIIVDYIQLLAAPSAEDRRNEIGEISRALKSLARELKVPVVAISQLNRGAEGREGNKPRLSDLRESGELEQDADTVMLIYRPAYYKGKAAQEAGQAPGGGGGGGSNGAEDAEVIIAKQRNGPTGIVNLTFRPNVLRFENQSGARA